MKVCPGCGTVMPLDAPSCRCGHQFKTQFYQSPPLVPPPVARTNGTIPRKVVPVWAWVLGGFGLIGFFCFGFPLLVNPKSSYVDTVPDNPADQQKLFRYLQSQARVGLCCNKPPDGGDWTGYQDYVSKTNTTMGFQEYESIRASNFLKALELTTSHKVPDRDAALMSRSLDLESARRGL